MSIGSWSKFSITAERQTNKYCLLISLLYSGGLFIEFLYQKYQIKE